MSKFIRPYMGLRISAWGCYKLTVYAAWIALVLAIVFGCGSCILLTLLAK